MFLSRSDFLTERSQPPSGSPCGELRPDGPFDWLVFHPSGRIAAHSLIQASREAGPILFALQSVPFLVLWSPTVGSRLTGLISYTLLGYNTLPAGVVIISFYHYL